MSVFKGDYMGFTYNGVHSSSLGIVRVSDGSRFTENLLPIFQEKTVQVPGGDGTYYFGSHYTQNKFSIQFAFDAMTEKQLNDLKILLSDRKPHPLVFDEAPYKIYQAKVTGSNTLKHIPFGQGAKNRIYKGEGEIQFVCYQPFAICKGQLRDSDFYDKKDGNFLEWNDAANLLSFESENLDKLINNQIRLYNPGVKESDFILTFSLNGKDRFYGATISLEDKKIEFSGCKPKKSYVGTEEKVDCAITFNSKNKLIEGWREVNGKREKSGNIYNEFIINGDFFNIPTSITKNYEQEDEVWKVFLLKILPRINQSKNLAEQFESVDYNYYYF